MDKKRNTEKVLNEIHINLKKTKKKQKKKQQTKKQKKKTHTYIFEYFN